VVILVDYAGFNMRIAKFAKARGIRVFYYILPKVVGLEPEAGLQDQGAGGPHVRDLPVRAGLYRQYDYTVDYVGNPLLDAIAAFSP
jgi:lipid-A-disaccharide synthase